MEDEGFPKEAVPATLKRLVRERRLSPDPRGRVSLAAKSTPGARLMTVEVEKVMQGSAVVVIDDRWHARLETANYGGLRELMKKGRRFKALCELYRSDGVLNLNVRQVVQAER